MTRIRSPHRRHATTIALVTVLALAGCGNSDADSEATTAASTVPLTSAPAESAPPAPAEGRLPAAEGVTEYPLTLSTWAGETVLEQRPERIAVIGFSPNLDALEALGVTPVYTQGEEAEWPWRDLEWLSQIEFVDSATRRDATNFEAIAAADPDLIVAVNYVQGDADFDILSQIAPVLENSEQIDGDKIEWQATQRLVGEALDLAGAADEVIATAEAAITATADANPDLTGRTITLATDYATSGLQYYSVQGGTAEGVLTMLGFSPNPHAAHFVDDPAVSEERLDLLDGDVLIVFFPDAAAREAREQTPLFAALPAVTDGRYIGVDDTDPGIDATWVMRRGASALSLPWTVEVIAGWVSAQGG